MFKIQQLFILLLGLGKTPMSVLMTAIMMSIIINMLSIFFIPSILSIMMIMAFNSGLMVLYMFFFSFIVEKKRKNKIIIYPLMLILLIPAFLLPNMSVEIFNFNTAISKSSMMFLSMLLIMVFSFIIVGVSSMYLNYKKV